MNTARKIRKMTFKHFDKIYSASVSISKSFDQKAISKPILKQCVELGKMKKTNKNKELHKYIDALNKMLDDLYDNCATYSKKMGADKVPFDYLKRAIDVCKNSFIKGQESQ